MVVLRHHRVSSPENLTPFGGAVGKVDAQAKSCSSFCFLESNLMSSFSIPRVEGGRWGHEREILPVDREEGVFFPFPLPTMAHKVTKCWRAE